ncbi:DUF397 domain-containing protein [Streptomyces sp. NRRL F-5650]|uniref:DUF397 domain-containing protein n=1 Tax=Streptomyces sp. NRRL F-5650 TaxID=1463868 RepID=UPI0004C8FEF0|nr:DUF397 domain-containing protein [Streptomyces sp. NRRL F-5650]
MRSHTALSNVEWRKSSYSGSNGGECVECTVRGGAAWRTSSYSGSNGGDCVEVSDGCPTGTVPVRDSKNPGGPVVTVGAHAWQSFVDALR